MKRTPKRPGQAVLVGLCALLGAAACGDTDDRPLEWSYIQATIIQPNCATARCHAQGSEAAGFRADTLELSCANLVPYNLYLVQLMRGEDVEERMPPDAPLPEGDIKLVERYFMENAMAGDDSCAP
jgi:hypothetical protein